jgi:hypothetical protein
LEAETQSPDPASGSRKPSGEDTSAVIYENDIQTVNPKVQKTRKLRRLDLSASQKPQSDRNAAAERRLERETGFEPATLSLEG